MRYKEDPSMQTNPLNLILPWLYPNLHVSNPPLTAFTPLHRMTTRKQSKFVPVNLFTQGLFSMTLPP